MNPDMPLRQLFVIGAMKSGTTSLFETLAQHPAICPSKEKEPDFFCEDRDDEARKRYQELWDWENGEYSYALEASVAYTKAPYVPGVPARIRNSGTSGAKFIYMLRDPIRRIESQVRHGIFAGWGKSLDEALPEDAISFSRYAMQIDQYMKYFPKEDFCLLTLEEFKDSPGAVLARICEFLGIDTMFAFSGTDEARNSGDFYESPTIVGRITQHPIGQYVSQRILPNGVRRRLRNLITRVSRNSSKNSSLGRSKLTSAEKEIVLGRIAPDLQKLRDFYGVDVEKYWDLRL